MGGNYDSAASDCQDEVDSLGLMYSHLAVGSRVPAPAPRARVHAQTRLGPCLGRA